MARTSPWAWLVRTPGSPVRAGIAAMGVAAAMAGSAAPADPPAGPASGADAGRARGTPADAFLLIDESLSIERARVVGLDGGAIEVAASDDSVETRARDRYVAMVRPASAWAGFIEPRGLGEAAGPARRTHVLELVDGQRLHGRVRESPEGGSGALRFEAQVGGSIRVPLERVARLGVASAAAPMEPVAADAASGPAIDDVVRLENGDDLSGFVVSIGTRVRIDTSAGERELPLEVVRAIELATERGEAPGPLVWLPDGGVVAGSVRIARPGLLEVEPAPVPGGPSGGEGARGASMRLDSIGAVAFEPSRLRPLASLELAGYEPGRGRRWVEPPRRQPGRAALLGAGMVELGAPMRARWRLPSGASRLAGRAVLPERSRVWGDCELVVSVVADSEAPQELARVRLSGASPSRRVNVELPPGARELVLELAPGERGAVQDRVEVRRGLVLIGR